MPPTALVTDTAAVRTPSAIVKLVPKRAFVTLTLGTITTPGEKKMYPYQHRPPKGLGWLDVIALLFSSHHRVVSRGGFEKLRGIDPLIQCERSTLA